MEEVKEAALAGVEVSLELFVEKAYEPVVDGLLKELAAQIPGGIDDAVIAALAPSLKPVVKQLLLAQIEKISEKV